MHDLRPGFNPLIIGIHWPSLPLETLNQSFDELERSLNQGAVDQSQIKQALSATAQLLDILKDLL